MYKKAWCTCKVIVFRIKTIVFLTFLSPSASLDLKVPINKIRWPHRGSLICLITSMITDRIGQQKVLYQLIITSGITKFVIIILRFLKLNTSYSESLLVAVKVKNIQVHAHDWVYCSIIGTLRSNDSTAAKMLLQKWICVLSVFIVIIPTYLLCQM